MRRILATTLRGSAPGRRVAMALWFVACWMVCVVAGSPQDARCSSYVCDLSDTAGSNYFDSSECGDTTACPSTCLAGNSLYSDLLNELGTGTAVRSKELWLPITDWLSAQFPNQIFKILASEVLGFTVRSAVMGDGWSVLCCASTVMWLEAWPGDPFPTDTQGSFYRLPIGYTGFGGLYVPNYVVEQYPLASAYNAYKMIAEYKTLFPSAFSTPCSETLVDPSAGCVDSNRHCAASEPYWPNTTCVDGRYVPPQCVGHNDCQEVIYGEPIWDTGFFESVVKNLGLNFTFVYVGTDNLFALIEAYAAQRRNFIFYMSGPDAILSKVPSTPVSFPPRTVWCEETENVDPTLSGGNCSYDQPVLYKVARGADIAALPDLKRLFDSLQLSSVKLQALMATHTSGGGALDVWNASCQWVRNNQAVWKPWIVNTPPPVASDSNGMIAVIAGVVGGLGAVVIAGGVLFLVHQRQQALKAIKNAPTQAPLALIFTDVESSTNLWEAYPEMAVAMDMHHSIIRELILEYQCYEVKTIGDSFMIACSSLVEAVSLSLAIQRKLYQAEWPSALRYWKGDEDAQPGMWNGLRVRAGVHWCTEVQPQLDAVHGRYDYYGHDVNVSARVESMAGGGQVMMTQETYRVLSQDTDFELLADEMHCRPFCKGAELKGVQGTVTLYSLTAAELAGRVFKPVPNTEPCGDVADGAATEVTSQQSASVSSTAAHETSTTTTVLRKYVEELLGFLASPADRDKAVTELLVKHKIVAAASDTKRLKYPRKLQYFLKHLSEALPQGPAAVGSMYRSGRGFKQPQLDQSMLSGGSMSLNVGAAYPLGSSVVVMSPTHDVVNTASSAFFTCKGEGSGHH